jgi:hypothetical protein
MANLAKLIDGMANPELSSLFTESERQMLLLVIAASKQKARPYEGDYKAPWLLVDFRAPVWFTTNRGREELIGGFWKNTLNVDWAVRLPNGALLTDPKYDRLLTLNKKIAFLIRSGYVGGIHAPITWKATVSIQLQLTSWLVLNESEFHPEVFGFKLLDQFSIDSLLRAIAGGGWTEARQAPQRLLAKLYENTFGETCPAHILDCVYDLPVNVREKITSWLADNEFFTTIPYGIYRQKSYLKRDRLGTEIGESVDSIKTSGKLNAFCRQFERDLQAGPLLVSIHQETEKPDHKTKLIKDVITTGAAENTLDTLTTAFVLILSAHRHAPDLLPEPGLISLRRAQRQAIALTRQSGHNRFIPVETGLTYFNRAMRFVHVYGEVLVNYYLAVIDERLSIKEKSSPDSTLDEECDELFGLQFKVLINGSERPIGSVLGIRRYRRPGAAMNHALLRSEPTLYEALRVLIGACVICIALMKPSRETELTHLKRDCLLRNSEGYHICFTLGKSNAGEAYQEKSRPIPVITARAIQLLQRLGEGLTSLFEDNRKFSDNLFYLPNDRGDGALAPSPDLLNSYLDTFCDYVGLAPDELGRRWYVRIHEMRKWFLLLLFWSGKYDVLDAARWIAGHTDVSHIYAYIEREFPGEELPKLEAEYAIERLQALEAAGRNAGRLESGLDALYEAVLRHFKVQSLSMVPDSEWVDYVVAMREADGFSLEPHSVYADENKAEVVGINVSFVLREIE